MSRSVGHGPGSVQPILETTLSDRLDEWSCGSCRTFWRSPRSGTSRGRRPGCISRTSSLSSSVRALERAGSDLFVRGTRQVELTEAGRALLSAARRTIAAAEDGRDAVAAIRGLVRGHLAIGAIQALAG